MIPGITLIYDFIVMFLEPSVSVGRRPLSRPSAASVKDLKKRFSFIAL